MKSNENVIFHRHFVNVVNVRTISSNAIRKTYFYYHYCFFKYVEWFIRLLGIFNVTIKSVILLKKIFAVRPYGWREKRSLVNGNRHENLLIFQL